MNTFRLLKRFTTLLGSYLVAPTGQLLNDPMAKAKQLKEQYGKNILFVIWHESIAAPLYFYRHRQLGLLREASAKGDDFAFVVRHYGYKDFAVTDNPADKRSVRGTIAFIKYLREGNHDGNIALDGPNGPRHIPKPGVFAIAKKTNLLIIPVGSWYSRKLVFKKRWDKFQLPLFFFKYVLEFGEPFPIPDVLNGDTLPKALADLTIAMHEINQRAAENAKKILAERAKQ